MTVLIIAIVLILIITDKSDKELMRDAEKLPTFTKKEAEFYYKEYINK
jgi:hypothetical protein